ncbi:hypothetical protein L596_024211 [Steinernema carpocapsae]|uniref:Moesin/ezrin/radixin homolog 1 n=1 Tax=Steinernema carpocapsae TaxID=34508 RepID=A0A4U5MG28_STECR|nr:hypothetical protein L596_024211 [Steinernema carpocapsae]
MPSFFRSISQRFRRHPVGGAAGGLPTSASLAPVASSSSYQKHPLDATTMSESQKMDHRKQCQCKVLLLDGTDMTIIIDKKATGQDVYAELFYMMDIDEHDYFGLQFTDHYHVQHWLDPLKKLSKQVPIGPPYTFRFRVKFYSSEPCNLREELTRYQFFLQLKQDIQSGRIECPKDTAAKLGALTLQSEFGDYDPKEHSALFVSEFRFHPSQDEQLELDILREYQQCKGQTPAQAELGYLNIVKWLELYGVDMHMVEGKDGNEYRLGLTPTGMIVFDGKQKIGLFCWEKIQKLDFRNKKLTIVVEEEADASNKGQIQLHTFVFNLASHKACKHLWKCAIEHHSFFRLKFHQPKNRPRQQLFRLGSTFHYRGRTEYENVHRDGRLSRRHSTFERRPSQRYVPRQTHAQNRQRVRQEMKDQIAAAAGIQPQQPKFEVVSVPEKIANAQSEIVPLSPSCEGSPLSSVGSSINSSGYHSAAPSKAAAAEARLDNLIYSGGVPQVQQLTQSPNAQKRIPETSATTLPASAVSGAPKDQILSSSGAQKPETAGFVPRSTPLLTNAGSGIRPPNSHVINIEINDKGLSSQSHVDPRLPQSPTRIPKYSAVAPTKPDEESCSPATNPLSNVSNEEGAPAVEDKSESVGTSLAKKPSGIPQPGSVSTSALPKKESHIRAPSAIPKRFGIPSSISESQMPKITPPSGASGRGSRLPVISRSATSGNVKESMPTPA